MQVKDLQLKRAMRSVLLILLLCLAGMTKMYAYNFSAVCETGQTLYYNITNATSHHVEVTYPGNSSSSPWDGYTKPTGNIILPGIVQYNGVTYVVTSISVRAFYNCSDLTGSLTIPNSVTRIDNYAFESCTGFTGNLTIPNSVVIIGPGAFSGCSGLTGNLTIPNSVTTIGSFAFSSCSGLTGNLIIPNSTVSIETNPFSGCSGLEHLEVASGNPVYDSRNNCNAIIKTNTNELVSGCMNSSIPNTVTSIGRYAFAACGLTSSLTIPNSVITIGDLAFSHCIGLTSLTIGNSVTTIGEQAFCGCSSLTSIIFGNSVTTIGNSAFKDCTGLTGSLTIPNSVTTIGPNAFKDCTGLSGSLTIGNSVTYIGSLAFYGCGGFTEINSLAETPPTLVYLTFQSVNIPVTVPCGAMSAYQNAPEWNYFANYFEGCSLHITATANPAEGGTVIGVGTFELGDTCTLVATPNEGFAFNNWTKNGNVVSTSSTYSFTVTGNATYVANFTNSAPIDYVSDGLIMYLDGINNTRNGHSTTTNVWEDLMGNYDLAVTNYNSYTWEGNHFIGLGNGGYLNTGRSWQYFNSLNNDLTIEIVTYIDCDKTSPAYRGLAGWHVNSDGTNFQNDQGGSTMQTLGGLPVSEADNTISTVTYTRANGSFLNGNWRTNINSIPSGVNSNQIVVFGNSHAQIRGWNDSIYCIRMYNRSLTPEEVAYNHNIDVERFGADNGGSTPIEDFVFNTYVDEDVYAMNSTIPIHGTVVDSQNAPVANVEVEIGVFVMGMKRTLQATTDAYGEFFATFEPMPTESGYYTINSGHVGNNSTAVHDEFNIPGMSVITDGYILCAVTQNQPKTESIRIRNKSNLPLNNIQVSVLSAPEGCSISFEPLSLNGLEESNLVYTINGTTLTEGNYYEEIKLKATSSIGAETEFSIWYYCMKPHGILEVTPSDITTTMTKGKSKIIDVMVSNHGTAATGEINIGLPNVEWMSVVGSNTLPSLAVNDSTYFSLRLSPGNNIALNQYTGNIAINCPQGGINLPFSITAVSDSTGSLHVDVTDEYSYYSIRGPHLANAEVTLTNYYSLETYHDSTNVAGTIDFENLPEGYYRIHVSAANHDDYYGIIYIDAGMTNQQDVFISYHAVTYSWNMVAGEIQDEYDFILNTTFETNVPVPVITIDAPESIPDFDGSYNFNYIIINHGLIDAYDVVLHIPEDENFLFTANIDYVDTLRAHDTIVIPCEVTRLTNNTNICKHWVKSWVNYNYTSGTNIIYKNAHDYTQLGTEQCGVTPPPASGGSGGGAPSFGGGGWGGGSGSPSLFINNIPVSTPSGSVNVQVGVQFNQQLVMTREAFFGTFIVHNGFDNAPLSNIGLNFTVKDENGNDCTNLFQISTQSLDNISSIDGNGTLGAGLDGMAQIVFIPTKAAAPTVPKDYYFGGTFTFHDPYIGNNLVCDLYPVKLTVHPSPDLYIDYFMQRDIIGDDALTLNVVEPSVPAELAVIINNKGAGMAKNVILETAEPMIVDNAQGLAIDFSIYSTSFNGNEEQLGLVGIPFGNIESGHTAVGEWMFTSSLLGHFVSYDAHVIHNNSYDNPELSLISHLDIHELIHPIRAYGSLEDGINDFLVNDVPDSHNYPDFIYFSNGGRTRVRVVNNISFDHEVTPLDTVVTLTVNPSRAGWNYGVVNDPGGKYVLVSCRRNNDNRNIPLQNVWETFVTLHDGQDPIYEDKLHIVDTVPSTQTVTYTLTYAVNPPEPSHVPVGAIDGLFSVSDSQQVYFSQGNLQYQATTNTWRFAENQWDYVGDANSNIGPDNSGWIDLFGWGTSGYDHGAIAYQPWSTNDNYTDYYAYGDWQYNLNDQTGKADWGYNAIANGGNRENQWRTLTHLEWKYVLNLRVTTSGIRFAKAKVNDVNGVILLPDDWDASYYSFNYPNARDVSFNSNIITAPQWSVLEQYGAVFLSAAGIRGGISIHNAGNNGGYWSASYFTNYGANHVGFDDSSLNPNPNTTLYSSRQIGISVRLVRTMQDNSTYTINTTCSPANGGTVTGAGTYNAGETCTLTAIANAGFTFTNWTENGLIVSTNAAYSFIVSANRVLVANFSYNNIDGMLNGKFSVSYNTKVYFSKGNLQYQASTNTWRFAENQWDCLRLENANVSSTYDGWIDLFGWGTSGYNHGAVCYQPWSTSENSSDYYAYGSSEYNLYDQTGKADWGYNAISNGGNTENQWRTLTSDEWSYLIFNRDTPSGIRFAKAVVNNIEGLVVLPDNWDASYYNLTETNSTSANYSTNIITGNDWMGVLEPRGVLFLPAGSYRFYTYVENENPFKGYYWSSTCSGWGIAEYFEFNNNQLFVDLRVLEDGLSVRLVKTVQEGNTQTTSLSRGWNWFSTYLDITLDDLKAALVEALPGTKIAIKSKNGSTAYNGRRWKGQLNSLDVAQMYMIGVPTGCEITLEGEPIDPAEHPVTIHYGANWIGFPLSESMTVRRAFGRFPVAGDVIKSQNNGAAKFNGTKWVGTLKTLEPGKGYIYMSKDQGTRIFTFPASAK